MRGYQQCEFLLSCTRRGMLGLSGYKTLGMSGIAQCLELEVQSCFRYHLIPLIGASRILRFCKNGVDRILEKQSSRHFIPVHTFYRVSSLAIAPKRLVSSINHARLWNLTKSSNTLSPASTNISVSPIPYLKDRNEIERFLLRREPSALCCIRQNLLSEVSS